MLSILRERESDRERERERERETERGREKERERASGSLALVKLIAIILGRRQLCGELLVSIVCQCITENVL